MNREVIERLVTDKRYFIENALQIESKQRMRVPFILKPVQEDMLATRSGRDIYVKPAQVGSTSIHMAIFYHDSITKPGTNSIVIAHEEFIAQHLLNKVHFWVDTVSEGFPKPRHKSAYEITWPELHSSFYIGSARSYIFGRGETIHNLLCSEFAYWPDTVRILAPALERIPPGGHLVIESTPNGELNEFHELYKSAKERYPLGTSAFKPHFYPWWVEADYSLPSDSPEALPTDRHPGLELTPDEEMLINRHCLTEDHIRWKRMKVVELEQLRRDGQTARLFSQEFPEDDETCFLATENMAYNSALLMEMEKYCTKPMLTGPDNIKIWKGPERDKHYVVAVDPGLAKQARTAITVWDFHIEKNEDGMEFEVGEHCATLAGLIPPAETALLAKNIGRLYNRALIAVEANGHGLAVISDLRDYSNLYRRRNIVSGQTSMEIGWLTTSRTKPYMIKELAKMLPNLRIHDRDILSEMRNVRIAGDTYITVGLDDLHMSAAIALSCRQARPKLRGLIGQAGWSKW